MKSPLLRLAFSLCLALALAAGGGFLLHRSLPFSEENLTTWTTSPVLLDREGKVFSVFLSGDSEWSIPIPLAAMGKWLPLVTVEVEDRRFRQHGGVDFPALFRAAWQNFRARRVVSGASTITSQLVRLSAPRPRTVGTKLLEFSSALKAEKALSKDRILELYLNRAPFGGNIRGVEAAARIYFSKAAAELSLGEAALLVGMLRGPSIYRPDRNPDAARKRRDSILNSLADRRVISDELRRLAMAERLPDGRGSLPSRAFHFSLLALGERKQGGTVHTTLDSPTQALLESVLSAALTTASPEVTAAGAVMANDTGEILAYVGNSRLGAGGTAHWVDCARSLRSPGSLLKPFAFLAAFELGLYTPASMLADTPLSFSGQAPRNFDMTYRGPVSARVALADSLNVPAVRVLRASGPEVVLSLLRSVGFRSLANPSSYYGDSLILGGCEVTLLQVLEAYGTLATLGIQRPPRPLKGEEMPDRRIASSGATYLVADILKDTARLLPLHGIRIEGSSTWFAFKTGTSYGFRDAWTAAYTPKFTVVVWMGDPTGKAHPELVGARAATPAIVEVLRKLHDGQWYSRPDDVVTRRVCSLSGAPASPACPLVREDFALLRTSFTHPCTLHVYRNGQPTVLWPSELEEFALRRSLEVRPENRVTIISPVPGSRYILTPFGGEQRVALKAEGARLPVFWFVGDRFVGRQDGPDPIFWTLERGTHSVSLVDRLGRTAVSQVTARTIEKEPEKTSGSAVLPLTPLD